MFKLFGAASIDYIHYFNRQDERFPLNQSTNFIFHRSIKSQTFSGRLEQWCIYFVAGLIVEISLLSFH